MGRVLTHGSLFSGIGGAEVAAEAVGWKNVFHCEIMDFPKRVLDYWFPDSESYGDITRTDFTRWRGHVDVLTGGFPCQPFSTAGKRRGEGDDRFLWFEMLRAIRECQPTWVVGENVVGLTTMVQPTDEARVEEKADLFGESDCHKTVSRYTIDTIIGSLEQEGYSVQTFIIPACAVGAPHRRDRVWIVGHRDGDAKPDGDLDANAEGERAEQREEGGVSEGDRADFLQAETARMEGVFHGRPCGLAGLPQPDTNADGRGRGSGERGRQEHQLLFDWHWDSAQGDKERGERLGGPGEAHDAGSGRPAANTDSDRLEERDIHEQLWRAKDERARASHATYSGEGYGWPSRKAEATGSTAERCPTGQLGRADLPQDWWRNFPSEPAVCGGDDGLPKGLDNLSIPHGRWRTETIKAYGNAWVPQVALEIFRAIDMVENNL